MASPVGSLRRYGSFSDGGIVRHGSDTGSDWSGIGAGDSHDQRYLVTFVSAD